MGLDALYDIGSAEKEASWTKLKGERYVWPYELSLLKLRAHTNRHLAFEIYQFESDKSIDALKQEFDQKPQPLVDWIRAHGNCLYSSYNPDRRRIR